MALKTKIIISLIFFLLVIDGITAKCPSESECGTCALVKKIINGEECKVCDCNKKNLCPQNECPKDCTKLSTEIEGQICSACVCS